MQKVLTSETKVMCHEYVNYFKPKGTFQATEITGFHFT